MSNDDLVGKTWQDAKKKYEWEITAVSATPGYVDVTVKSLLTGVSSDTCLPANVARRTVELNGG